METNQRYKYCKGWGRAMSPNVINVYCEACEETQLFDKVRDFFRSYEVNEYDVAEHFGISVRIVKQWIKEGRIEYKERGTRSIGGSYCSHCGTKVSFGTLCSKCLKLLNGEGIQGFSAAPKEEEGRMRFMDKDK